MLCTGSVVHWGVYWHNELKKANYANAILRHKEEHYVDFAIWCRGDQTEILDSWTRLQKLNQ